ncbi:MAG: 4-hydroxybenzoate octaprenyltransferase [Alphaproteobacteria bacterium]|nr:4-hydroxybenzoate octaprenyltransferase [Alphaproteobacteria bacterium]
MALIKSVAKIVAAFVGQFKRVQILTQAVPLCFDVMRLNSPIGWILLVIPGYWGFIWCGGTYSVALWITAGAIWARSLGCFYNDWVDRSLDAKVTRTKHRPLVAHPPSWAMVGLAVGFFITGILVFSYFLPLSCILIAGIGLLGTLIYPWCKRFTYYPQILLGLIFNLSVWMSPCMTGAPFSWGLLVLYIYGIIWTVSYDTLYAFQDLPEDVPAGIYSLALKMGPKKGHKILGWLMAVRFALLFVLLMGAGSIAFGGKPAEWSAYIPALFTVFSQWNMWRKWDLSVHTNCAEYFRYSVIEGAQVCLVLISIGKLHLKWYVWLLDLVG